MKTLLNTILILLAFPAAAQYVGINNNNPTEALDVTGNIKVSGTIKPNGSNGLPGQVLTRNSSGGMEWRSISGSGDENVATYMATTAGAVQTFIVPANITRICVEAWGGGGAGGATIANFISHPLGSGGGGGGGYIKAWFTVTPGDNITITVGKGATAATAAGNTTVTAGAVTITAQAGTNASATVDLLTQGVQSVSGRGGFFAVSDPNFRAYSFSKGIDGKPVIYRSFYVVEPITNTDRLADSYDWGDGGNAGNAVSAGVGGHSVFITSIASLFLFQSSRGSDGGVPGGGGGGDRGRITSGGDGLVVIKY